MAEGAVYNVILCLYFFEIREVFYHSSVWIEASLAAIGGELRGGDLIPVVFDVLSALVLDFQSCSMRAQLHLRKVL